MGGRTVTTFLRTLLICLQTSQPAWMAQLLLQRKGRGCAARSQAVEDISDIGWCGGGRTRIELEGGGEKCQKDVEEVWCGRGRCGMCRGMEGRGAWKGATCACVVVRGGGRGLHLVLTWGWCRSGAPCSRRRPRSPRSLASPSRTRIKSHCCRTRPKCQRRTWSSGCTSCSRRPGGVRMRCTHTHAHNCSGVRVV